MGHIMCLGSSLCSGLLRCFTILKVEVVHAEVEVLIDHHTKHHTWHMERCTSSLASCFTLVCQALSYRISYRLWPPTTLSKSSLSITN